MENGRVVAIEKIVSVLCALLLVCGLAPSAWADDASDSAAAQDSQSASQTTSGRTSRLDGSARESSSLIVREPEDDGTSEESQQDAQEDVQEQSASEESDADLYGYTYAVAALNRTSGHGTLDLISCADATEQSCRVAENAWEHSDYAVLLQADDQANALPALALAGALGCPVLLVQGDEQVGTLMDTLESLGVNQAVVVGKGSAFSTVLMNALAALPQGSARLSGGSDIEVQIAICQYGQKLGVWRLDGAFVASPSADSLAYAAQVACSKRPVFLTPVKGGLTQGQSKCLADLAASSATRRWTLTALGSEDAVSATVMSSAKLALLSEGCNVKEERLASDDAARAAFDVAEGLSQNGSIGWDSLVLTTPGDTSSLIAGVAAQAYAGQAFLLIDDDSAQWVSEALGGKQVESILYLDGAAALSQSAQKTLEAHLGFTEVIYERVGSLSALADVQVDSMASIYGAENVSKDELMANMDANALEWGDAAFYQFAILTDGFSGAVTADQLDAWIDQNAAEGSMFKGAGKYFIAAARKYNINEVYLLAHAALESAWGSSTLATGGISGYSGYYNFFGIGAYDSNPSYGAVYAAEHGWNTVEAAVMGAAEFISSTYVNADSGQNTLYYMRWNVKNGGTHQYASSPLWAGSIAKLMAQCYELNGISMSNSGFRFLVPVYSE